MRKETILALWTKFLLYGGFGGLCILLLASCRSELLSYAFQEGCFMALIKIYNLWWSYWLFCLMLIAGVVISAVQWVKACKGERDASQKDTP